MRTLGSYRRDSEINFIYQRIAFMSNTPSTTQSLLKQKIRIRITITIRRSPGRAAMRPSVAKSLEIDGFYFPVNVCFCVFFGFPDSLVAYSLPPKADLPLAEKSCAIVKGQ